ncbi:MAG: NrfD/PsrC family molybdoenzyme membrane anchor subunit, partial [Saprospiraceae bacterium]
KRFFYVLLRPQWNSWLVKGGYAITLYGGLLTFLAVAQWFELTGLFSVLMWTTAIVAVVVAIYTAFLFAQAKGRDFWQSPTLSIHMLLHSFLAGSAVFAILALFMDTGANWLPLLRNVLLTGIGINLATMLIELTTTHPTEDAKRTVDMITKGRYKNNFWGVVVLLGNVIPFVIALLGGLSGVSLALAGVAVLIGIYMTEHIWVEAPQRLPLS